MRVHTNTLAYLAIVLLGIALALPGLGEIPFTQGDDATYFATLQSLSLLLHWGGNNWAAVIGGVADIDGLSLLYQQERSELILPYYSKPIFDLIYWLAIQIGGAKLQALLYANVLFLAIAIWCMARIGQELYGFYTGLLAALFFATSGSALVYVRTGMAHMASLAFLLLGAHLYLQLIRRSNKHDLRWGWLVGAVWGMSLAIHPNLLPYIGLCGIAALFYGWRQYGPGSAILHSARLAAGALTVGLVVEVGYCFMGLFYRDVFTTAFGWSVPFRTYLAQVALHADAVIDGHVSLVQKVYTYMLLFWAHEGLLVCLLIGLAVVLWCRERSDEKTLFILMLFWIPHLFFIFSKNQAVYRYAAGCVLPASLLAGFALERILLNWQGRESWLLRHSIIWGIFAVVVVNISHIKPIYAVESAWSSTARWLSLHDQTHVISTAGRTLWHINGIRSADPSDGIGSIRYLALYKRYEKEREIELIEEFGDGAEPVFIAPHRRPDKLLEIEFLTSNLLLDAFATLPGIGDYIAEMRYRALDMNKLHFIELYELKNASESDWGTCRDEVVQPTSQRG